MIERHVNFEVLAGKAREFERMFIQEYRPAMAGMTGFIKAELLRQNESSTAYQMVIRFDCPESASAWRASAEHQALSPRLKVLYSGSQLNVYEVIA